MSEDVNLKVTYYGKDFVLNKDNEEFLKHVEKTIDETKAALEHAQKEFTDRYTNHQNPKLKRIANKVKVTIGREVSDKVKSNTYNVLYGVISFSPSDYDFCTKCRKLISKCAGL